MRLRTVCTPNLIRSRFLSGAATVYLTLPALLLGQQTITTFAGNGAGTFAGDGGPATSAALNKPVFTALDPAGNLYIADETNQRIRKVAPDGTISTIAGNGAQGYGGDGGPATGASFNTPIGVAADTKGNLYIADALNRRIRKIDPSGTITTVAGNGAAADAGDGVPATSASLSIPVRVAVDSTGNLYIADQGAHKIKKVGTDGTIRTIAGSGARGFSGDGGPATGAALDNPTAVAVDAAGVVYFSDQLNHRIRRVDKAGAITTVAGNGAAGFGGDGGPATGASLNFPGGLVVDQSGEIFFADDLNFRVRKFTPGGNLVTVAGNGTQGFSGDGGPAASASLNGQFGVSLDQAGNLYISDSGNNRIRKVSNAGAITVPAFTSAGVTNGASFVAGLSPGAIVTIFGTNLSNNVSGILLAYQAPLPTTMAGVSVTIGGIAAPLFAVDNVGGSEQVNVQVPFEVAGQANVPIVVNNGRGTETVQVAVSKAHPGIFSSDGVNGAILHGVGNALVTDANPADKNEVVVIFATGLGEVTPASPTGALAPSSPPSKTNLQPSVTIGGLASEVQYSGLAPGFVGLYQVNAVVPAAVASGSVDVVIAVEGSSSKAVKLQVR